MSLIIKMVLNESYDSEKEEFIPNETIDLEFVHTLRTVSAWESKKLKPFLSSEEKTSEDTVDYLRIMLLDKSKAEYLSLLSATDFSTLTDYIESQKTATWFSDDKGSPSREIITSELIYYWMISFGIPFECQDWHLSRLLTLIRVCSEKNKPQKKMDPKTLASRNQALNAARLSKTK